MISIVLESAVGFMSKSCYSQSSFTIQFVFERLVMIHYKRVLQVVQLPAERAWCLTKKLTKCRNEVGHSWITGHCTDILDRLIGLQ